MAAVFVPEYNMLVFDEFSTDKAYQRVYFKGTSGVPSDFTPVNVYFAIYSVNRCVTDATSFPLSVRTCVDGIPELDAQTNRNLTFFPEVLRDFSFFLEDLPPASFGNLPLAGNELDETLWPDVMSLTIGGLRSTNTSSWLEVSSPVEGFRVAMIFAHEAGQK